MNELMWHPSQYSYKTSACLAENYFIKGFYFTLQQIMAHLTKESSIKEPICDNCPFDEPIIPDKSISTCPT
jgi:hypothetical protein